jgi:hypothetical protein
MKPTTCFLPLAALAGLILATGSANAATTFTWTGGAGTGSDWFDAGNWDAAGVPLLGTNLYGSQTSTDYVIWDSETAAGNYMPSGTITPASSWTSNSRMPNTELRNGTLTIGQSINWGHNGNTFVIGDGDATNAATVNVNWSNLNRDPNGTKSYVVNSDGTLNITTGLSKFSDSAAKDAAIVINGGSVVVSGSINSNFIDDSGDYVSFGTTGGTFTANFGGQLPDLATITAQFGDSFQDTTGNGLTATDNLDNTFTVSVIPEPGTTLLVGLACALGLVRRRS